MKRFSLIILGALLFASCGSDPKSTKVRDFQSMTAEKQAAMAKSLSPEDASLLGACIAKKASTGDTSFMDMTVGQLIEEGKKDMPK